MSDVFLTDADLASMDLPLAMRAAVSLSGLTDKPQMQCVLALIEICAF